MCKKNWSPLLWKNPGSVQEKSIKKMLLAFLYYNISHKIKIKYKLIFMTTFEVSWFSFENMQGTMQEARGYSVHNHWESLLQPSRSVECGRSWGHHKSAGEGWQEAAQLDKFEAKLGWEMGD